MKLQEKYVAENMNKTKTNLQFPLMIFIVGFGQVIFKRRDSTQESRVINSAGWYEFSQSLIKSRNVDILPRHLNRFVNTFPRHFIIQILKKNNRPACVTESLSGENRSAGEI